MTDETILDLLERSDWVIRGTVRKTRASSLPEVPASDHTSVVRVDEVLHGPSQFSDHVGRDVTLYSDDAGGLGARRQAVFFTRSWLYGRSLAVIEVGRLVRKGGKTLTDEVRRAEEVAFDRRLAERIARASVIVAGEVVDQGSAPGLERPIESEHVPDWAMAYVRVNDVLKGEKPNEILPVVYPQSNDELWIDSPKLVRGVAGVLILQEDQQEKGFPILRVRGLSALDPLDLQPLEMLDRIRRLIDAGGYE